MTQYYVSVLRNTYRYNIVTLECKKNTLFKIYSDHGKYIVIGSMFV